MLTLVLLCIVTYFFALVYYYNFFADLDPYCTSIWKCFTWILVQTFYSGSGFLGSSQEDYYDNWDFSFRIPFDFSYIFIVCILITQILSGQQIIQLTELNVFSVYNNNRYNHRLVRLIERGNVEEAGRHGRNLLHLWTECIGA